MDKEKGKNLICTKQLQSMPLITITSQFTAMHHD